MFYLNSVNLRTMVRNLGNYQKTETLHTLEFILKFIYLSKATELNRKF